MRYWYAICFLKGCLTPLRLQALKRNVPVSTMKRTPRFASFTSTLTNGTFEVLPSMT